MKKFNSNQPNIFEILCQTISEGIIIVDENLKITASNQAAHLMFGYKEEELAGESLNLLIPKPHQSSAAAEFDKYFKNQKPAKFGADKDLHALKKNGEKIPIEVSLNLFQLEDKQFLMFLFNDISLRKKQEEEILHLNRKLGKLVDERTTELREIIVDLKEEISKRKKAESKIKAALDKEKELNELKTKFLSLVSHEFKTPLSVILSSATLTKKYTDTEHQKKREKHLENIKLKVRSLNNILNDFLSIERIESDNNSYNIAYFPLSRVVNNVVYDANMLSKKGQIINYPDNINEIVVHYDEKILELSLTNLINNAIKYSPENTTIDIAVKIKNDLLNISVSDQGIGISEKDQKYIFNPYFRAENVTHKQGTGIGLNIVKGHLENLNSTIHFKSIENKGSIFTINIPYHKNKITQ